MKTQRGEERREKILQVAESIILQKGFSATSIDEILEDAHITKGGFFYHFSDKTELARGLVERYLEQDEVLFNGLVARARELTEDPLQQYLLFINLLAEVMESLESVHPGCLVASFTYESKQFDDTVLGLIREGILRWRDLFQQQLEAAAAVYPPREEVSLEELADMLSSIVEGGIILSRVLEDNRMLVRQIRQYRNYIKHLFAAG